MVTSILVEGGKTKTVCAVLRDGEVLGWALGGPTGWSIIGREKVVTALKELLNNSLASSGVNLGEVDLAIIGLPDLDTNTTQEYFYTRLRPLFPERTELVLVPDINVAFYAVTGGEAGIVVIAGTGSVAYGRNKDGLEARAGGWGWLGDDEGSGLWISIQALNRAFRFADGRGEETALLKMITEYFSLRDPLDLIDVVPEAFFTDPRKISGIAKLVDDAAAQGDRVAREILREAAYSLYEMVNAVYRKIFKEGEKCAVGGVGSVFSSGVVSTEFRDLLLKKMPNVVFKGTLTSYKPVRGLAYMLAEKLGYGDRALFADKVTSEVEKAIREGAW